MKILKKLFLIVLTIVSVASVLYAIIMQSLLCYQRFGVIFTSENLFIPHESAWGFLGVFGCYLAIKFFE